MSMKNMYPQRGAGRRDGRDSMRLMLTRFCASVSGARAPRRACSRQTSPAKCGRCRSAPDEVAEDQETRGVVGAPRWSAPHVQPVALGRLPPAIAAAPISVPARCAAPRSRRRERARAGQVLRSQPLHCARDGHASRRPHGPQAFPWKGDSAARALDLRAIEAAWQGRRSSVRPTTLRSSSHTPHANCTAPDSSAGTRHRPSRRLALDRAAEMLRTASSLNVPSGPR